MIRTIQGWAITTSLLAACLLASVAAVAQSGAKPPAGSAIQPVQVVNTPNVNVVNTPTVNLAGGASVGVTNTLNNQNNPAPLAVLEAIQPYEDSCFFHFNGSNDGTCNFQPIPAGKRLVIEAVDAWGKAESGTKPVAEFLSNLTTVTDHHLVPFPLADDNFFSYFSAQQQTRLYVASGVTLTFTTIVNHSSDNGFWTCAISGFLVDVP